MSLIDRENNRTRCGSQKMSRINKNTTIFCASEVSFEFREINPTLADAKHTRIMKIFADALVRHGQETDKEQIKANA